MFFFSSSLSRLRIVGGGGGLHFIISAYTWRQFDVINGVKLECFNV